MAGLCIVVIQKQSSISIKKSEFGVFFWFCFFFFFKGISFVGHLGFYIFVFFMEYPHSPPY